MVLPIPGATASPKVARDAILLTVQPVAGSHQTADSREPLDLSTARRTACAASPKTHLSLAQSVRYNGGGIGLARSRIRTEVSTEPSGRSSCFCGSLVGARNGFTDIAKIRHLKS